MRRNLATWTRLALVATALLGTQAGCKSGWKMPGTNGFAWSKKPSEATLAGSSPSISVPSSSNGSGPSYSVPGSGSVVSNVTGTNSQPTGPAARNTPNLLASSAKTSPYANKNTNAGAAANSNGYQTGPYLTSTGGRPSGYTAPTGYGKDPAAVPSATLASNASQSPATPNTAASSGFPPMPNLPPAGSVFPPPPGAAPSPAAAGNALAGLPQPNLPATNAPNFGLPPSIGPSPSNNLAAGLPPAGLPYTGANSGAGVAATPVGLSGAGLPALPPANSSMPNALAGATPPGLPSIGTPSLPLPPSPTSPVAAAPMYSGATPYRPGSTSRQTSYDFSAPSATANTNGTGVVPQTATPNLPSGTNLYR